MLRRFFLIDDDVDDSELFMEALTEIDPAIICYHAFDGQTALEKLRQHEISDPDIIFLDINMPGMNGWQFLSSLKKEDALRHIPVVMYSTSSAKRDYDIARVMGALCFLTKPSDYKALKSVLGQITQSQSTDQLPVIAASSNEARH